MSKTASIYDLKKSLLPAVTTYVLIDPLIEEPVHVEPSEDAESLQAEREAAWEAKVYPIALNNKIKLAQQYHPYCIALSSDDDDLLEATLTLAELERNQSQSEGLAGAGTGAHAIGGWLQTTMLPDQLTTQLSNMMLANTSKPITTHYQRLADRRVLDWLIELVGKVRVENTLGAIQRWSYLDAFGNIKQINKTSDEAQALRLSADEWTRFMQGADLHPTIARWLGELCNLEENQRATKQAAPQQNTYQRVAEALERASYAAKRWPERFKDAHDYTAWAALHLLHGAFEQNTEALKLLSTPPTEDEPTSSFNTICPQLNSLLQRTTS